MSNSLYQILSSGSLSADIVAALNAANTPTAGNPFATIADLGAGGITSLNTLTGATQTFASGTTGTDFNIASAGTTHTFNFPDASAANRGLLTSANWTTFNNKLSNITGLVSAGTNVTITGTGVSGDPFVINSSGGGGAGDLATVLGIGNDAGAQDIKNLSAIQDSTTATSVDIENRRLIDAAGSRSVDWGSWVLYNSVSNVVFDWENFTFPTLAGGGTLMLTVDNTGAILTQAIPSGGGITTLNTLSGATQTFATGTTGTDFGISSAGTTHTFNIPVASGTNTGKLSSTDWTTFNNKVSSTRAVNTANSLTGGGDLSADRTLQLVNDSASPGNSFYYGTDSGGTKGFFSLPGGSGSITLGNSIFVATTGNDGTGTVDRLDLPFLTIAAAAAAASAGDTIFVYPGDYTFTSALTLADGVNYCFLGTGSVTGTNLTRLFTPTSNSTVEIYAPGWTFECIEFGKNFDFSGLTNVNLKFTFDQLIADWEDNIAHACTSSLLQFTGNYIYTNLGDGNLVGGTVTGSKVIAHIKRWEITQTSMRNIDVQFGDIYVEADHLYAPNGGNIFVQNHNGGCDMHFNVKYLQSGGGVWPVWFIGTGKRMFVNANYMVGASDCLLVSTGLAGGRGEVYATIEHIHNDFVGEPDGIVHAEGGLLHLTNAQMTRGASCVDGGDIKAQFFNSQQGQLYLKDVSYDVTRQQLNNADSAKTWVNGGWVNVPFIQNNAAGSGNAITDCYLPDCTINFASFTGCTLSDVTAQGRTITFTANSQTITNKTMLTKNIPMVTTEASSPTPTINTNNTDIHRITALATNITSMTTNLSGSPMYGEKLMIEFTDNGSARTITWGASFASTTVALPVTTVASTPLLVALQYNGTLWVCVGVA